MASNDEWFQPLYRRVIVFLVAVGMFVAEWLLWGEEIWLYLFGGIALYAGYEFFFSGKYENSLRRK
jgi:hypothetical protein